MKDVKIGMGFSKGLREWRLLDLLHADDPVLCDELKEDLRVRPGNFAGLCKRRNLKVIVDKRQSDGVRGVWMILLRLGEMWEKMLGE